MTYREAFEQGKAALMQAQIEEADLDARLLLEYVCQTNRNDLLVHGDKIVGEEEADAYLALISRRAGHIPLQYLTGTQEFMGLSFEVNESVLIPRQDTEILVEEVLRELHDGMRILDMCTGSGCILISLLCYSNDCRGVGVDISGEALEVARRNAGRILNGLQTGDSFGKDDSTEESLLGKRAVWLQSDLFENVEGKFEFIVSNPPYIASGEIPALMPEVRDYEPVLALDGSEDGLYFYRRIIEGSKNHLTGGGMLYFEIGCGQAEEVTRLMEQAGFTEVKIVKDLAGLDRVVYGTFID